MVQCRIYCKWMIFLYSGYLLKIKGSVNDAWNYTVSALKSILPEMNCLFFSVQV